jgi:hypothetical protein
MADLPAISGCIDEAFAATATQRLQGSAEATNIILQKSCFCRNTVIQTYFFHPFRISLLAHFTHVASGPQTLFPMSNSSSGNGTSILSGWNPSPNERGTADILLSCLFTIVLCCWTTVCPNVPALSETRWCQFRDKFRSCVYRAARTRVFVRNRSWPA